MKRLIIVNGTMGAGKTVTCTQLLQKLQPGVMLDGDWCWSMQPFVVNDETKRMVLDNICFVLNNFLHCSEYDNILFCWVLHLQSIIDEILGRLDLSNTQVFIYTLVVSPQALTARIVKDVEANKRTVDQIERSLARIGLYADMNTVKIDVSGITPEQAADEIIGRILI
jgi:tRNA uridine 5-carbamoylmethylation protein Kti12